MSGPELSSRRERAGVSRRRLASVLGVAHPTLARWERGDFPVPPWVPGRLGGALRACEPKTSAEVVLSLLDDEPGISRRALVARFPGGGFEATVDAMLRSGQVEQARAERIDAAGRRYVRPGLYRSGRAPAPPSAAPIGAAWVRTQRQQLGMATSALAQRLDVAPSTLRAWESGHEPVPEGRWSELRRLLDPPVSGDDVREARRAAGWTLKEFGSRIGVRMGQVAGWECGLRPVPEKRLAAVRAALRDARQAAEQRDRDEELAAKVVAWLGEHPGVTRNALLHRSEAPREQWAGGLELALERGLVVEATVALPGPRGHLRSWRRLYLASAAPAAPGDSLTGEQVRSERELRELRLADVSLHVGVAPSALASWERRGAQPIPAWWTTRVREALAVATPPPNAPSRLKLRLVGEIGAEPGISPYRLLHRPAARGGGRGAGGAKSAEALLAELLASGDVVEAENYDTLGRSRRGLWRADDAPPPAGDAPLTAEELRRARTSAGLSQRDLAERLGIRASNISEWESGSRRINSNRSGELRRALAQPPSRPGPVAKIAAAYAEQVRAAPEGLSVDALRPHWYGTRNLRAHAGLARALAEGSLHWAVVARTGADARRYEARVLRPGPAPGTGANPASLAGEHLKALREAAGLSQGYLARSLGISQTAISKWECGAAVPLPWVPQLLAALASAPGQSEEELRRALAEPMPRLDPVARIAALYGEQARAHSDGLSVKDLRPRLEDVKNGRAALDRALAEGALHWATASGVRKDGHRYTKRVLRAGPAASGQP